MVVIVGIDLKRTTKNGLDGLIVHEAVHVWQAAQEAMAADEKDEFEAYISARRTQE